MKSRRLASQEALAVEMLGRGVTQRAVASALGASQAWVSLVYRRHGGAGRRSPERQKRIVELRQRGLTYAAIAREVGCRQPWVYKVLRRHRQTRPRRDGFCAASVGADYETEEAAFLAACAKYQQARGRKFLRATDYLAVLKGLGYRR